LRASSEGCERSHDSSIPVSMNFLPFEVLPANSADSE